MLDRCVMRGGNPSHNSLTRRTCAFRSVSGLLGAGHFPVCPHLRDLAGSALPLLPRLPSRPPLSGRPLLPLPLGHHLDPSHQGTPRCLCFCEDCLRRAKGGGVLCLVSPFSSLLRARLISFFLFSRWQGGEPVVEGSEIWVPVSVRVAVSGLVSLCVCLCLRVCLSVCLRVCVCVSVTAGVSVSVTVSVPFVSLKVPFAFISVPA